MSPAPIRARHAPWATAALRRHVRGRAAKRFHGWWVGGEGLEAACDASQPLLLLPNHTSWWDGFVALELAHRLGHRFHVMMQADQLAQIPFFARVGAFSVDHGDRRQAEADLAYAATLLVPGNGVWIFPQGRRMPAGAPLVIASGAARLARAAAPVRVVPVALRYPFVSEELPEAFAWIGRPFAVDPGASLGAARRLIGAELAGAVGRLDAALATTERAGFEPLLAGAPSANKWWPAQLARLGLVGPEAVRNG